MINIFMVAHREMAQEGLSLLILKEKQNFNIVTIASDGETAFKCLNLFPHDILLIDAHFLPPHGAFWLTKRIFENYPDEKIILISDATTRLYLDEAIAIGIKAYLSHDVTPLELTTTIKEVYEGGRYFKESGDKKTLIDPYFLTFHIKRLGLTPRETQILPLILNGLNNDVIASTFAITVAQVKYHKKALYSKLNVENDVALLRYFLNYHSIV